MSQLHKGTPSDILNLLSNPATSIPKGAQWAVIIEGLLDLKTAIEKAYEMEPQKWETTKSMQKILVDDFLTKVGCLFCTAIDLPGEGSNPVAEGSIKSNNFIRSYVGAGRNDFSMMRMSFVDTNISFCDTFLRGWALATSAFGMIAREDIKYRTTMSCMKFGITPEGPTIVQKYTFKGICCVNVGNEEQNYDTVTSMPKREANFVYNYYSLNTDAENVFLSTNKPLLLY